MALGIFFRWTARNTWPIIMEIRMQSIISIIKLIAVLAAAVFVGNWFLSELRKARATGGPWYQPYLSIPGLIIVAAVFLPILLKIFGKL